MNNRRVNRTLIAIAVVAVAVFAYGKYNFPGDGLEDGEGITGTYVVNGTDPLEVEYSGTVTINATDLADEYVLQWIVTGTIQEGTGRLTGDILDVSWHTITSARGESTGTAVYTVDDDGVLRGTRSVDGLAAVGTEEIFPEP